MRKSVIITLESFVAAYSAAKRPEQRQAALKAAMEALRRPGTQTEPLLNLKQIAAHCKVNVTTAWRWELPTVDFRGLKRYRVSECDRYLASAAFRQRRVQLREQRRDKVAVKAHATKVGGRRGSRDVRSSGRRVSSTRRPEKGKA